MIKPEEYFPNASKQGVVKGILDVIVLLYLLSYKGEFIIGTLNFLSSYKSNFPNESFLGKFHLIGIDARCVN